MRKPGFCICENKDEDQLRGNREADQRLCFRYSDSMILLLSKSKISRLQPSSVVVQPGLCRTGRKSRSPVFSERGSNGPVEGDSEVGSIYPCAAIESNITWSRIAVQSETCCIWFPVDCQDIGISSFLALQDYIGISSFQALQDSNVSWHCLRYNALNYHSVSSHFLEDLIISNRFEPTSSQRAVLCLTIHFSLTCQVVHVTQCTPHHTKPLFVKPITLIRQDSNTQQDQ